MRFVAKKADGGVNKGKISLYCRDDAYPSLAVDMSIVPWGLRRS